MKRAIFVGVLALALGGGALMAQNGANGSQTSGRLRTAVWDNGAAIVTPVRDHDRDDWRAHDRGRTYRVRPYVYNYPYTYTSPYYAYPYRHPYAYPGYSYRGYAPYGYGHGYGYSGRDYRHWRHEERERIEHERHERREHHHH